MATRSQANRALESFQRELNQCKNVVGLGIVPVDESALGETSKDLAVAVYVSKKIPLEKLAEKDRIPESLAIRGKGGDLSVPVRVIEQGVVQKQSLGKPQRL